MSTGIQFKQFPPKAKTGTRCTSGAYGPAAAAFAGVLLLLAIPVQGEPVPCVGDCDQNGKVDVSEVVVGLSIALGEAILDDCPAFDGNRNGAVDVGDLVEGVSTLLNGCARAPAPTPTETPATATPTLTPGPNQIVYLLSGTFNDQPALGRMVWVPSERFFPNHVFYDVVSFAFGDVQGVGEVDFFTLSNTFTLRLDAILAGQDIELMGTAPLASNAPLLPGEFHVSGDGVSLVFTGVRPRPPDLPTRTPTPSATGSPSVPTTTASSSVSPTPFPEDGKGIISVRIVDVSFYPPQAGVRIAIVGSDQVSFSDENGAAVFEVAPGDYFVDADVCCRGYRSIEYHVPVTVLEGETSEVELQACYLCICASPETPIATPNGEIPIRALTVGDLVYSIHEGRIVATPIQQTNRVAVRGHHVVRVRLETGAVLEISPGHPTADGRTFGELRAGDKLGEVEILSVEVVPYAHDHTYDILPASDSGVYFAGGVPIGSTLHRPLSAIPNPRGETITALLTGRHTNPEHAGL